MGQTQNEVAVKPDANLPTEAQDISAFGDHVVNTKSIMLPKILLMQKMSEMVDDGDAQVGEFRESLDKTLIGSVEKPFEVIPFHVDEVWVIQKEIDGDWKFDRIEPMGPSNEGWRYEGMEDGSKVRRYHTQNYYVLLPGDVKKGNALPYVLSFRSTSLKAGKKLYTHMYAKCLGTGIRPDAYHVRVSASKQKNDKGVFYVMDVRSGDKSTKAELDESLKWIRIVKAGQTKIDDSDTGDF